MREMDPWQDIFGPSDWPDGKGTVPKVPTETMTATYIPTEHDIRFCNANLVGSEEDDPQDSIIGFYHYYSDAYRRLICDHFELKGESRLLVEMKAQTFIHKTDETFCVALSPGFMGLRADCDPDGSAKLPGQGPVRLTKYWPEVKQYMVTALPQPQRGAETELIVIGDDFLCLSATRTPVANIGLLVRETHSFDPDKVVACRYATPEDIADLTENTVNRYKKICLARVGPTALRWLNWECILVR